jgi:hypothetical protein
MYSNMSMGGDMMKSSSGKCSHKNKLHSGGYKESNEEKEGPRSIRKKVSFRQ